MNTLLRFISKYQQYIIGFALLLVVLVFTWKGLYSSIQPYLQPEAITSWIKSFGPWAWVFFILALVLSGMSPFPDTPIVLAGGAVFGPWLGSLLAVIANTFGFLINYFIAKKLGSEWVTKQFPQVMKVVSSLEEHYGWQTVLAFRFVPLLPFDWVSYACGISKMNFTQFFFASIAGNAPLLIAFVLLGSNVTSFSPTTLAITLGLFILLIVVAQVIKNKNTLLKEIK
jgi:uncharacterized membrane protein YdjX (TVP38/TMEM64 family)